MDDYISQPFTCEALHATSLAGSPGAHITSAPSCAALAATADIREELDHEMRRSA
jgi:hypothetical protein